MSYRDELINELNQYVANRIMDIRCQQNLTQEDIATKLGITRQAYGKYENGLTPINLPILSHIAFILKTSISHFLPPEYTFNYQWQTNDTISDYVSSPYTNDAIDYDLLIHLFAKLHTDEQKHLLSYIRYKVQTKKEESDTSEHT